MQKHNWNFLSIFANWICKVTCIGIPTVFYRLKLKHRRITVISRNCIGGVIYHQFGLKFLSPTINLFMGFDDFNCFCNNLENYINGSLDEIESDEYYPLGMLTPESLLLPPIKIHFMHYKSFAEAKSKWNERKKRIVWNNIYVVNCCSYDFELCEITESTIKSFNTVKYPKVFFSFKKLGFENEVIVKESGIDCFRRREKTWKYPFNDFDLIAFFNK